MNYHWSYDGYDCDILVAGYFKDQPSNRGLFANVFSGEYESDYGYGSPNYYI